MVPFDGNFDPGYWYTALIGTAGPANSARQDGECSRFVDAWPEAWTPVAAGCPALLRSDPGGSALTVEGNAWLLADAIGSGVALGYESDDRTVRAVFHRAYVDHPTFKPVVLSIPAPSLGQSDPTFVVYTAGILRADSRT